MPVSSTLLLHATDIACTRQRRVLFLLPGFTIAAGECIELRGANGSGKTTLLRALAGLFPCEGTVSVRTPLVWVGHRNGNAGLLTPLENLRWHQRLLGLAAPDEVLLRHLDRVGLLRAAAQPVQHLSQGQQRRLALARLLLSPAKLWLLDEPGTALDTSGADLLDSMLAAHCNAGGGALVASHTSLRVATRVFDLSLPQPPVGVAA